MKRICLVLDELYPFTAGGIGRVAHNSILDALAQSTELEFHLLLPSYLEIDSRRAGTYFGERVHAHLAEMRSGSEQTLEHGSVYPPAAAHTDSIWHAQSLDFLRALKTLSARDGFRFDLVEFPDYRGWAFCTLQEKLLGLDFAETEIVVRVHTTDGMLQRYEPREPSWEQLGRFDLERKALHDADRVVVHLRDTGQLNADYYAFEPRWLDKVTVSFPPAVYPFPEPPSAQGAPRDILFLTKLQPIKRPDLFVRGTAQFLRENPGFTGRAVLACHAMDDAYRDEVRRLVPKDLEARFLFLPAGPEREALIASSVVVIPSAYESFNLVAYEASAAGAVLVLNAECPAFGERTPWRDGVNCYKFDGTVDGLARTLSRAAVESRPRPVEWKADPPYWLDAAPARRADPSLRPNPLVSVVVTNYNLGRYLPQALASVAASTYENVEVIVVDDASTEPFDALVLQRIETESGKNAVHLLRNPVNRGLPASRNIGIRHARGEYVLPLDADDCISSRFIEIAVGALERQPDFDVVVPTAGYFRDEPSLAERRFSNYALFLGDAPSIGLVWNRMSCATSMMRRSLFAEVSYDETLPSYEDWELYLRFVHMGRRFLVTNDIQFHYRERAGSMLAGMHPERHISLLSRIFASLPRPLPPSAHLFALLAPALGHAREVARLREENVALTQAAGPKPLRYNLVDAVNSAIKRMPFIHPLLKASISRFGRTP